MSHRRLFSPDIVGSDAFLEMPVSSRELYFQLGMYADDDGFINPKKIMRMVGAGDDDLKVILTKRFALPFESGVIVIKHWLIHNTIRKDRYKETQYLDEKKTLYIKENGAYTEVATNGLPVGNQMAPQVKLSKVKLSNTFERFWSLFPKKVAKRKAELAWDKIPAEDHESIYAHVQGIKNTDQWKIKGGQFIPHPTTYLNEERWKSVLELPKKKNPNEMTQAEMRAEWQG